MTAYRCKCGVHFAVDQGKPSTCPCCQETHFTKVDIRGSYTEH